MQLYFIRHGQSENNLLYDQTGTWDSRNEDPELTPVGRQQAQCLAQRLARRVDDFVPYHRRDHTNATGFGLTHLYTSLMIRAVATGAPAAQAMGLPLIAWPDVHETGGIYLDDPVTGQPIGLPGKTRADFESRYANLILPDWLDHQGWWNCRPVETEEDKSARVQRFLAELQARHGGTADRVGVVTHGAFYNRTLAALFNIPYREGQWFGLNNTAITRIDFDEHETVVVYMNRTDHLPRELVT